MYQGNENLCFFFFTAKLKWSHILVSSWWLRNLRSLIWRRDVISGFISVCPGASIVNQQYPWESSMFLRNKQTLYPLKFLLYQSNAGNTILKHDSKHNYIWSHSTHMGPHASNSWDALVSGKESVFLDFLIIPENENWEDKIKHLRWNSRVPLVPKSLHEFSP